MCAEIGRVLGGPGFRGDRYQIVSIWPIDFFFLLGDWSDRCGMRCRITSDGRGDPAFEYTGQKLKEFVF